VMRTFLAFLHMGNVLCVTDQVPSSHSSGGAVHSAGGARLYFRGLRRRILLWAGVEGAAGLGSVVSAGVGIVVLGWVVPVWSAIFLRRCCCCYGFDDFQLMKVASHKPVILQIKFQVSSGSIPA
jgi:hypothetical protein